MPTSVTDSLLRARRFLLHPRLTGGPWRLRTGHRLRGVGPRVSLCQRDRGRLPYRRRSDDGIARHHPPQRRVHHSSRTPQPPQTRVLGARPAGPSPRLRPMDPGNLGPTGCEKPVPMGDFVLRLAEERFLGPGITDRHGQVVLAGVERRRYQAIPAVGLPDSVLGDDMGATLPEQVESSLMGQRIARDRLMMRGNDEEPDVPGHQ